MGESIHNPPVSSPPSSESLRDPILLIDEWSESLALAPRCTCTSAHLEQREMWVDEKSARAPKTKYIGRTSKGDDELTQNPK